MNLDFFSKPFFIRFVFFLSFDFILSLISLYFSYQLRFNFDIPDYFFNKFIDIFFTLFAIKSFFILVFKNYFIVWRLFNLNDVKNLIVAHALTYILFIGLYMIKFSWIVPIAGSVIVIDFFLSLSFLTLLRMVKRFYLEQRHLISDNTTIIIGANEKTSYLIQSSRKGEILFNPVAIFTVDEVRQEFHNSYISNIRVYDLSKLDQFSKQFKIESAIIVEEIEHKKLNNLFEKLKELKINNIKTFPSLTDKNIKNISIEDLLARKPKDLDKTQIKKFVENKTILITGAGGSIGSELVKQVFDFNAKKIILLDHSEFNLYQIDDELQNLINSQNKNIEKLNYMISIVNRERLETVFKNNKIDIILHSAAYKHVPLCEENIQSAVENNIIGSKNLIELAIKYEIPKVVVISTDKAVRPTNVMGATKRAVELLLQNIDSKNTELVAVRFGNVLNSSGSVIPKFRKQLENNQPITVTHPDITRYFMMISEACQLVLQAGSIAKGGEIFILDMGKPVKIVDLANKMRQLYQKEYIPIKFIGLRAGEKKYEELLLSDAEVKTKYESIFVTAPTKYKIDDLNKDLENLVSEKSDSKKIEILNKIVPEFAHKINN